MIVKKIFFVGFLVLMLSVSFIGPAFSQGKQGETKISSRKIEGVTQDFKYMSINEREILIPPGIKVFDDRGNILKITDLKPGCNAFLEIIRNKDGSTEKRIVIKK